MKSSRFQYRYRVNASKLHKAVGEILRNSDEFRSYEAYQEYPVNRVNTSYINGTHHFDWVIPKLKLVIECHGKQHFEPVAFGGDDETAIEAFHATQQRDITKKEAALDAGFVYIEVVYSLLNKLNLVKFLELYEIGKAQLQEYSIDTDRKQEWQKNVKTHTEEFTTKKKHEDKKRRQRYLASPEHKEALEKARDFRKTRYRSWKEIRRNSEE